jgi:ABC-type antimicrobial peptide transport system permease subunit
MANEFWKGRDALGECFYLFKRSNPCQRIVGVVTNVRWYLTQPPLRIFYQPAAGPLYRCCGMVSVRTRNVATAAMVGEVRRLVSDLPGHDPLYPPTPRLVTERLEPQFRPWRVAAAMFLLFGLLALIATGTGIFGLVAYDVTQRTHEFGVRLTLGASAASILQLVLRSGLRIIAVGLVIGIAAALAAGRVIQSLLFETRAWDPGALGVTSAVVALIALAASAVPAWRATRVDPMVALRAE